MVVTNIRYARPPSEIILMSLPLVFYSSIPTKSLFWNQKTLSKVHIWCTWNVCSFSTFFSRWPPYLRFIIKNISLDFFFLADRDCYRHTTTWGHIEPVLLANTAVHIWIQSTHIFWPFELYGTSDQGKKRSVLVNFNQIYRLKQRWCIV